MLYETGTQLSLYSNAATSCNYFKSGIFYQYNFNTHILRHGQIMNLKKILPWAAALLILTALVLMNIDRIRYAHDAARSFMLNDLGYMPRRGSINIGKNHITPAVKTYSGAESGLFHIGPLVMYSTSMPMSVHEIAGKMVRYTDYYRTGNLAVAIEKINAIRGTAPGGTVLFIPAPLPAQTASLTATRKKNIPHTRGLYYSGFTAGTNEFIRSLPDLTAAGINSVVIDLKDVGGTLSWKSETPLAKKYNTDKMSCIDNPALMIRELHRNGLYVIGRIAVFRDECLAKRDKSLAIRSRRADTVWTAGGREIWCDPTNRTVQDYNIALAIEMADMGVDEVQFDYIRFPTGGDHGDAVFANHFGVKSREENIVSFLDRVHPELKKRGVPLSIDIFGVVAWGKEVDIKKTGQRIELLAGHCDVISPMLYPSHFNDDFDGYSRPGDEPYYFITEGCKKVIALTGSGTIVRPWLQAFGWRVSRYNEKYITEQVRGSNDAGATGYLFWNAANNYDTVLKAMKDVVRMEAKVARR